jgi:hypothetical protein
MNQKDKALQDLIFIQEALGALGFTLAGDNTYYKDYGLLDGSVVRIIPHFDKGISVDMSYRLCALTVTNTRTVPIVEGKPVQFEYFPRECLNDVTQMLANLAPQSRMPLKETYIITAICDKCGLEVSSFFQDKGRRLCLKCI